MLLGKALAALRVSRGLTQHQVAELAGLTPQRICRTERGCHYPRHVTLKRILSGMGVTFAALHRAQELVENPMGEGAEPMDAPDFTPEEAHQAAPSGSRRKRARRSRTAACRSWRWAPAVGASRPAPATAPAVLILAAWRSENGAQLPRYVRIARTPDPVPSRTPTPERGWRAADRHTTEGQRQGTPAAGSGQTWAGCFDVGGSARAAASGGRSCKPAGWQLSSTE